MKISIITATLQAERYLPDCLASVKAQAARGFEVEQIVADGGSTDGTVRLATEAGCKVLTGRDSGVYDAMNKGVAASSGDVIGFLNCDDLMLPGALEAIAGWHPRRRAGWMVGGMRWIDAGGASLGQTAAPPALMFQRMYASLGWSCIWHPSTYMTRELFDELGGFDVSYRYSGDYDLLSRALGREPFDRVDHVLTAFRCHGDNLSLSANPRLLAENRQVAASYAPRSAVLRTLYRQALRGWINARNPSWFLGKKAPRLAQSLDRTHWGSRGGNGDSPVA